MTGPCKRKVLALCLGSAAIMASPVLLADKATDARLDSIERKLDSRGLMDMLGRVEKMQQEIQRLRGDLEVQAHTLDEIQRRSREQYLDMDRRLQQLESGQVGAPAVGGPALAPVPGLDAGTTPPVSTTLPPVQATTPPAQSTPPAMQANERADYDQALAILREGRYDEAAQAFDRFLASYPGSSYADNASYWLGETYYVTRDFDRALAMFQGLTERYPNSPKAPDSFLKTGYIHYEKQEWAAARAALDTVVSGYPGTTAARLASDRLQRMQKEGH